MSNTITAYFKGRVGVAESVYQNDYGIVMAFDSIDLPAHFDCYFSILNQEEAIPGVGADGMVAIPNSVLANPGAVTIHIPIHTGANDSEVEYVVHFKVIGRARPEDDGTPAQMTAIERALALLQSPITNIEEIVNEALSFTGDTFQDMKADLQEDYNDFSSAVSDDIADFKTEVRGDVDAVESDFADLAEDFDNLDAQFQTAVAAVTTDTEVTNIRVGDDNVTYTTAGEAVRKQFANVKNELSSAVDMETYLKDELETQGKVIIGTAISDNQHYGISDPIYLKKNTRIVGKTYTDIATISVVASCDSNGSITGTLVSGVAAGYAQVNYLMKNSGYVRFCLRAASTIGQLFTILDVSEQSDDTKADIASISKLITHGENFINKDAVSVLGEWCNYSNGKIESNSYVANYRHSPYLEVKPSTYYSRRYGSGDASVVFFNEDLMYLGYSRNDIFQTPANCRYLIYNINTAIEPINNAVLIEGNEVINSSANIYPTPAYYNKFAYADPFVYEKDYVTVGASNADFTEVGAAFTYARNNDKYVVIKPGTYDLVEEGISGNGYILPKKVVGYGATLLCHLDSEDWDLSPLNTIYTGDGFQVYGLTVDVQNCRYCIHDEMGAKSTGGYHNIFKDLHLIHRSQKSATLISPNCIGGGWGNNGYIEIENCVMEAANATNCDYHSSFQGTQNDSSVTIIKECVLNKTVTASSIGTDTSFKNTMYVNGNLMGTIPTASDTANAKLVEWNNASL